MDWRQNYLAVSQGSEPQALALRLAETRRAYQAVLANWTHDLLLLRARGMLTPGIRPSPVRPHLTIASTARALSRTTHSPSLRHAA